MRVSLGIKAIGPLMSRVLQVVIFHVRQVILSA